MRGLILLAGLITAAACGGCVADPGYGYGYGYPPYGYLPYGYPAYGYAAPYYGPGYAYGPTVGFGFGGYGYSGDRGWRGNDDPHRGNWAGGGGGRAPAPPPRSEPPPAPQRPGTGIDVGKNYGGPQ